MKYKPVYGDDNVLVPPYAYMNSSASEEDKDECYSTYLKMCKRDAKFNRQALGYDNVFKEQSKANPPPGDPFDEDPYAYIEFKNTDSLIMYNKHK